MYAMANVPRFHAGFGKSDLTCILGIARDSSNSAVSHSGGGGGGADVKGRKTVFQPQRPRARYWKYLPHFLPARLSVP